MNTQKTKGSFPGFNYHIADVQKYVRSSDTFTLMLKNGTIIHYTSQEAEIFERWLKDHHITSLKQ